VIHLIYISSATSWPSENDLLELLTQSRARNLKQNITGLLIYHNATFMQVLEGSAEDVHDIYNSILRDSRNTGNVILVEEEISERNFPDWSMGFKNLETCSPEDIPGFNDLFNGKLDKETANINKEKSVRLIMSFASKAQEDLI